MTNSTILNNSAVSYRWGMGGGILNGYLYPLTLTDSVVSGNSADSSGGGIYNDGGTLTLTNSTIANNLTAWSGGGIISSSGLVALTNSSISNNSATFAGGGVCYISGWPAYATALTLINSSISNNTAAGNGGGIYGSGTGAVTLTNSTVSSNSATDRGGGIYSSGTLTLYNSALALNSAGELGSDIDGEVTAGSSHNFIGDSSGLSGITDGVNGNIVGGGDPMWTAVTDAEGTVLYYVPQASSPLIDAGDDALAVDAEGMPLTTDQAGGPRISGPSVDIGPVERRLLGDMDGSGAVNNNDISPFVLALTNRPQYLIDFPGIDPDVVGDIDGSGALNNNDITPFVALLTGGGMSNDHTPSTNSSEQRGASTAAEQSLAPVVNDAVAADNAAGANRKALYAGRFGRDELGSTNLFVEAPGSTSHVTAGARLVAAPSAANFSLDSRMNNSFVAARQRTRRRTRTYAMRSRRPARQKTTALNVLGEAPVLQIDLRPAR